MYNAGATSTLIASGPIYFQNTSDGGKSYYIGDVAKFEISQSVETKDLVSGRAGKGAKLKSLSRLKDVKAKITFNEINAKTLELALRAGITDVAAGSVSNETHADVGIDALVMFDYLPDAAQTITVKSEDGNTTYVLGTDYDLETVGIVPKAGGAIAEDATIKVSYTKLASSIIAALLNSGKEYSIVAALVNEAESDRKFTLRIPKITFTPASSVSLIGTDFATLEVEGDILQAPNETAPYFLYPQNAA